ncbi:TPA: hypothetical protein RZK55_001019 [Campylobacter jejuni]|nr:hypothetical protein [Campylobacter jejuni]
MKAYHTKEQVIIKLSKDEYRKEMKLNKSLKDENRFLKTEISNLENEKIRYLEKEIQRLKGVIALKDTAINEISLKLEEEIKINVKLSNFRIKILDTLGLIGVFKNDDKAIKEVKRLKDKECK